MTKRSSYGSFRRVKLLLWLVLRQLRKDYLFLATIKMIDEIVSVVKRTRRRRGRRKTTVDDGTESRY
jgi:hypothetical protein